MAKPAGVVKKLEPDELAVLRRRFNHRQPYQQLFDHIECLEREVSRVHAAFRERSQNASQGWDDSEGVRELFLAATGKTPEEYLGVEA